MQPRNKHKSEPTECAAHIHQQSNNQINFIPVVYKHARQLHEIPHEMATTEISRSIYSATIRVRR